MTRAVVAAVCLARRVVRLGETNVLKSKQLPEIWGRWVNPSRAQKTGQSIGGRMSLGDREARKAWTELRLNSSNDRTKWVIRCPTQPQCLFMQS